MVHFGDEEKKSRQGKSCALCLFVEKEVFFTLASTLFGLYLRTHINTFDMGPCDGLVMLHG